VAWRHALPRQPPKAENVVVSVLLRDFFRVSDTGQVWKKAVEMCGGAHAAVTAVFVAGACRS